MAVVKNRGFLVIVALAIVSSAGAAAQNSNETPYAASRLIGRWRTIMNRTLEDTRAFAAEEVTDLIEEFVSPGAVRAVQDKATGAQAGPSMNHDTEFRPPVREVLQVAFEALCRVVGLKRPDVAHLALHE